MPKTPRDATDAELAVLQVLWNRGDCTIRQITDVLYPRGSTSDYSTVQKLLERLADKGCVKRRRAGGVHVFSPAIDRDELIGRRLSDVAAKLCEGSLTPLLTHLVKQHGTTAEQRQALRQLVDDLSRGKPRGTRRAEGEP